MSKKLLMGNEAIAYGAICAGVKLVCGYPGTPSTEVLETVAKNNDGSIYVEWSVNEKAAIEVAAAASYSGARTMITMKQMGLNVASDPVMCVNYVGIKGGMVIVVADDPGPISSQTEQDTRHFAEYAKMMVFDPSSPSEAYQMVMDAFDYSEKYKKPVIFRPTTRVCHSYETIELIERKKEPDIEGFVKDSKKWVIFPRLSYNNHIELEKKMVDISNDFSSYRFNTVSFDGELGIVAGGVSYEYVREIIKDRKDIKLLKIATPNPMPEKLIVDYLKGLSKVLVCEELDPYLEREITYICGKYNLPVKVYGKLTGSVVNAGENSVSGLSKSISDFLSEDLLIEASACETPELPVRPPVLCAGCPHRASFYAVKKAMAGKKTYYCGDIGCYTLGNALPLDMVDTCLCMGADITMAHGFSKVDKDAYSFAFIGDSTFFASGLTGVANAIYNQANITIVLLDNSTTAMTGHQPHPGTGVTMMGDIVNKINPEPVLKAMGAAKVVTVNPLDIEKAINTVKEVAEINGVKVIIFKSPCIAVTKPGPQVIIDNQKCINCKKCIKELGCPAIVLKDGKPYIEKSLCFGCSICESICPVNAINKQEGKNNE